MDFTNSGSIQSSSSGDDYYDFRAEAITSSFNLPPQPPPPPSSSHHPPPSSFTSASPHVNTFPSTPPDPNHSSLDMTWARSLRPSSPSQHGCTTILDGPTTASSSSTKTTAVAALRRSPPSGGGSLNPSVQPAQPTAGTPRGPKKRSRASRRAPTTVLATDTSNFRAMVQKLTGFPAAPFISSPFPRPRLDLFRAATTAPPFPLGPLAPKLQPPLFAPISSSSSMAHLASYLSRHGVATANPSATSARSNASPSSNSPSSNYQLPSVLLQHPNLLHMQSPGFAFQSALQPQTPPDRNPSTMPAFEANPPLGPWDLAAGGLGGLIAMEGEKLSRRAQEFSGWADGSAPEGMGSRSQLRSVIGNYDNLQLVGNHAEKASESMTLAGGAGRVDSWFLSSD